MKKHTPCHCEICESDRYNSKCAGCKDGHPSFWKTITESKWWSAWEKEQRKRFSFIDKKIAKGVFDIDECRECGVLGKEHWTEFVKFIKKLK